MQREIKFRAWNTESKRWIDNVCFSTAFGVLDSNHQGFDEEIIINQYTGLKDKNGVEIYDGDIVEFEEHRNGKMYYKTKEAVSFDFGQFNIYGTSLRDFQNIEVIGNIYQNSDLIK